MAVSALPSRQTLDTVPERFTLLMGVAQSLPARAALMAPCDTAECGPGFEPAPLEGGCCACEATMVLPECGQELQDEYDAAKAAILEGLGAPECDNDDDRVVQGIFNQCCSQCSAPLHREIAEQFQEEVSAWASEHCTGCPQADFECPMVETRPRCYDGACVVETNQ